MRSSVSVLYREPKLLKVEALVGLDNRDVSVSVLYREPKLLKAIFETVPLIGANCFSALP